MASLPAQPWRLILSQPLAGPENMALDEALMESVAAEAPLHAPAAAGDEPMRSKLPEPSGASLGFQPGLRVEPAPILRLYAWHPACLSIGYAQPAEQIDLTALRDHGWDLVRRPTGGRAILHADELTYAVIGPAEGDIFAGGILPSYRRISRALIAALRGMGLDPELHPAPEPRSSGGHRRRSRPPDPLASGDPICFQIPSAYEITVQGRKLIGSAQVRRHGVVLQHGSLPLKGDITRVCRALRYPDGAARARGQKKLQARAATVESLLGSPVSWAAAARAFQRGFEQALGSRFHAVEPSCEVRARASELAQRRYRSARWTERV